MIEVEDEIILAPSLTEREFGPVDDGPEVGLVVLFKGGLVRNILTGELFDGEPVPGVIVGMSKHGVIIQIEGTGFLGWVTKNLYRVLNLVLPDTKSVH